jgi:hypothetical protein
MVHVVSIWRPSQATNIVPLSNLNPNFPGHPRDAGVFHVDTDFAGLLEMGPWLKQNFSL